MSFTYLIDHSQPASRRSNAPPCPYPTTPDQRCTTNPQTQPNSCFRGSTAPSVLAIMRASRLPSPRSIYLSPNLDSFRYRTSLRPAHPSPTVESPDPPTRRALARCMSIHRTVRTSTSTDLYPQITCRPIPSHGLHSPRQTANSHAPTDRAPPCRTG